MTQPSTEPPADPGTDPAAASTEPATGDEKDWRAETEKWKTQARRHEDRAKANAAAATELEKLRAANQTEHERAVAEAKAAGRAEAEAAVRSELIAARFEAEALRAGRDADAVAGLLEDLDLSRFVGEDGAIDVGRIRKRVEALPAAGQQQRRGDTGQGRGAAPPVAPGAAGLAEAQRRFGVPQQAQA